jgi:type I restriction enzyme, S subunit
MSDAANRHRPPLPPGWAWAKLNDLCSPIESIAPARDMVNQSRFRYVDFGAVRDQKIVSPQELVPVNAPSRARQKIAADDTLFSCVRVYLENVARVPQELDGAVASTAFAVLRPRVGIDPAYLHWLVRRPQFIRSMVEKQRGNSPPAVLETEVKADEVPVPPRPSKLGSQHALMSCSEKSKPANRSCRRRARGWRPIAAPC